ncbi:hypothetical protein FWH13_03265 [Candidatus Saccharibacteria bacterium]|nr:hypothetical protein [Candidatus Saccharibacteria bacterium]
MKKQKQTGRVIIPPDLDQYPEPHEISAAKILAAHFETQVIFLKRNLNYKQKSPDVRFLGLNWEIKSPKSVA